MGGGPAIWSREGSEAPTGSGGKGTKKRKKVVKGNYHSLGRVMVIMARMMAITFHPPTRQHPRVRITIRVARRTR